MKKTAEELKTDEFRAQHLILNTELADIEAELHAARARSSSWREAGRAFRRLLVLLEVDVAAQMDDEERQLYAPMREHAGVLSPTLATCYGEHHDLRVMTSELHAELLRAYSGHEPIPDQLFAHVDRMIALIRQHMAREDGALFASAEQEIPRTEPITPLTD